MNYIVLDLEWNQPVSKKIYPYTQIGDRLPFEILQIGAVKLNEDLEIIDNFKISIKPRYYLKIHSKVMRLTKLNLEEIIFGIDFRTAAKHFKNWCGNEFVFITWGDEDIKVLKQNLDMNKCKLNWVDQYYNLQIMFNQQFNLGKNQIGLSYAIEFLGIQANKQFHNALNDAFYTAQIFIRHNINKCFIEYDAEFFKSKVKQDNDSEKQPNKCVNEICFPEETPTQLNALALAAN